MRSKMIWNHGRDLINTREGNIWWDIENRNRQWKERKKGFTEKRTKIEEKNLTRKQNGKTNYIKDKFCWNIKDENKWKEFKIEEWKILMRICKS